jgi:hypothetical protein
MWFAYVLSAVPGALLALLAATGMVAESTAVALFAPSFIGLNLAHMAATWGHAYLDGPVAPVERILIPAVIVVSCLGLEAAGFGALLLLFQYWLSIHHAAMQNYGLLRSTQPGRGRRLEPRSGRRIDQAACVLLPLGALAYRARICRFYDGAVLPAPPPWLAPILMGAGALAIALFLRRERHLLSAALVAGVTLLWSGLLIGIAHPALPLYALASGHYVQQLYFVWKRGDFARGTAPLAYLVALTAAAGAVVLALLLLTLGARSLAGTASPIPPWVAAMIGVNLSHYWLEHRIWRASAAPSRA